MSYDLSFVHTLGLGVGEESRPMKCPFCQADHEHKFSVRRTDQGYLYSCFRAKCGESGFVRDNGHYVARNTPKEIDEDKPYERAGYFKAATAQDRLFFYRAWGVDITGERIYITEDDEYAFAILGPKGNRKGWHIRQPRWKLTRCHRLGAPGPKGMTYMDKKGTSKLAWFNNSDNRDTLILVEDLVSAMKVSKYRPCAALLGASLTKSSVQEIRDSGVTKVVVWLDPDAKSSGLEILTKHGLSLPNVMAISTEDDPKDTPDIVIEAILEEYDI